MENPDGSYGISIHAPLAGCDSRRHDRWNTLKNFNPRTPCGVRPQSRAMAHKSINFNPRTPCGVRLPYPSGSTSVLPFQSTHPLRGATVKPRPILTTCTFQSTHPLRGATVEAVSPSARLSISIHAPLAGCDAAIFSSSPCSPFQSTHPLRGATLGDGRDVAHRHISIHAPLAGCDPSHRAGTRRAHHFNPRTPCGVRRLLYRVQPRFTRNFNPRTPCGVRLYVAMAIYRRLVISIHAPLAGCDSRPRSPLRLPLHFNPRTPCGVRRGHSADAVPGL